MDLNLFKYLSKKLLACNISTYLCGLNQFRSEISCKSMFTKLLKTDYCTLLSYISCLNCTKKNLIVFVITEHINMFETLTTAMIDFENI